MAAGSAGSHAGRIGVATPGAFRRRCPRAVLASCLRNGLAREWCGWFLPLWSTIGSTPASST